MLLHVMFLYSVIQLSYYIVYFRIKFMFYVRFYDFYTVLLYFHFLVGVRADFAGAYHFVHLIFLVVIRRYLS